jgi:hypothetical protein
MSTKSLVRGSPDRPQAQTVTVRNRSTRDIALIMTEASYESDGSRTPTCRSARDFLSMRASRSPLNPGD